MTTVRPGGAAAAAADGPSALADESAMARNQTQSRFDVGDFATWLSAKQANSTMAPLDSAWFHTHSSKPRTVQHEIALLKVAMFNYEGVDDDSGNDSGENKNCVWDKKKHSSNGATREAILRRDNASLADFDQRDLPKGGGPVIGMAEGRQWTAIGVCRRCFLRVAQGQTMPNLPQKHTSRSRSKTA